MKPITEMVEAEIDENIFKELRMKAPYLEPHPLSEEVKNKFPPETVLFELKTTKHLIGYVYLAPRADGSWVYYGFVCKPVRSEQWHVDGFVSQEEAKTAYNRKALHFILKHLDH